MARLRRTYTPEFKTEAVKLVTEQGYSVAEAARSLGLRDNLLCNWKQALEAQGPQAFPGPGKLPAIEEEIRRPEKANNFQPPAASSLPKRLRPRLPPSRAWRGRSRW